MIYVVRKNCGTIDALIFFAELDQFLKTKVSNNFDFSSSLHVYNGVAFFE